MSVVWRRIDTPASRWAELLSEVRAEQPDHPELAAELFRGDPSTAYMYARRLRAGLVPSTSGETPLDTAGFVFHVKQAGGNRCVLYGQWVGGEQLSLLAGAEMETA
jgi:hypothetical protein